MADQRKSSQLLGLIARRHGLSAGSSAGESAGDHLGLESPLEDPALLPSGSDLGDRLSDILDAIPADEIADPASFARARELILTRGSEVIEKARNSGAGVRFAPSEVAVMEAVIRTDGSRPSLMLRDGEVPDDHPFLGAWADAVKGSRDAIARLSASVGRIEPFRGSPNAYFGTGFVIDTARGIALTNRHVLEDMWTYLAEFAERKDDRITFADGAYINFAAEVDSLDKARCRIIEGRFVGPTGTGNAALDAALLKIVPLTDEEAKRERGRAIPVPRALELTASRDGPLGQLNSFCIIGFPGRIPPPGERGEAEDKVDWNWVSQALMGGRHGVKRIAPGTVHHPLGTLSDDPKTWCFGHDVTTLGGNSGSPAIAWKDQDEPVFGLHFAGLTTETNYAHAMSEILDEIRTAKAAF